MAIDVFQEHILTFSEATRLLPRRRAGRKPHVSTCYRWATRGLRGICLETIQVGGTTCTSREALQRFFERLQAANHPADFRASRSHSGRERAIKRAEELLRKAGW